MLQLLSASLLLLLLVVVDSHRCCCSCCCCCCAGWTAAWPADSNRHTCTISGSNAADAAAKKVAAEESIHIVQSCTHTRTTCKAMQSARDSSQLSTAVSLPPQGCDGASQTRNNRHLLDCWCFRTATAACRASIESALPRWLTQWCTPGCNNEPFQRAAPFCWIHCFQQNNQLAQHPPCIRWLCICCTTLLYSTTCCCSSPAGTPSAQGVQTFEHMHRVRREQRVTD
jgi:hypothetical protein